MDEVVVQIQDFETKGNIPDFSVIAETENFATRVVEKLEE